jgi:hypothetical protein
MLDGFWSSELIVTESGLEGESHGYCYGLSDGRDQMMMRGDSTRRLALYCSSS